MKDWKQRLEAYGRLGLYVYVVIWLSTMAVIFAMLRLGMQESVPWLATYAGDGATLFGAWVGAKALQIPRIGLTIAVTPVLARWMGRTPAAAPAAVAPPAAPVAEPVE